MKNICMLLLTAAIWGFAFVAQSVGMDYVGPFTFNCVRNIIGATFLVPCIFLLDRLKGEEKKQDIGDKKTLIVGGICCGIALCLASNFQQLGIMSTSVGKAGFLTALYIIIVPIMGIFLKRRCSVNVWISVVIALIGFYLLSVKEGLVLEKGDALVIISAVLFSVHILVIDYFSPKTDGVRMAAIQFLVCGILSGIAMLFTEQVSIDGIISAWAPILYAGVLSCGVAYTLQIVGQKNFNPTIASLILSLESVFSVIGGFIILKQELSLRELLGCVIIFVGIILAQLPSKK